MKTIHAVMEEIKEIAKQAGIQPTVTPRSDETEPEGIEGYDTLTPSMSDMSLVQSMSGNCAVYEDKDSHLVFYPALEGTVKQLTRHRVPIKIRSGVTSSRSDAMETGLRMAREKGASRFAVVTLLRKIVPDNYWVEKVDFFPSNS